MKYAIYDKAADAYLTKMVFEVGYSQHTQFECALTEYITNAELLDTKEAANLAIVNIEGFKFMEKGRFVIHKFDDTLTDQYIISEAGNPTKVVDNITVDLNGTIDVKYGTMAYHWSTDWLMRAITRMDALQKAASDVYTPWRDTFDIYKVITIIDERECTHYQFIKVTEKCLDSAKEEEKNLVVGKDITDITDPLNKRIEELEKANSILTENVDYHKECRTVLADMIRAIKYAIYYIKDSNKRNSYISYMTDKIKNDEIFNRPELKTAKNDIPRLCKHLTALVENPLYKRIEDLEKANYDLGEQATARGAVANRLQEENDKLEAKVESIKKEARHWKTMYESETETLDILKDIVDTIYTDLQSVTACDDLKDTLKALSHNSDLDHIFMPTKTIYVLDKEDCLTAKDEIYYIVNHMITILESRELNQGVAFSSAEEVDCAKKLANDIIDICEADDKFEITLKKFSQLYEAVNNPSDDDDTIMYALKGVLEIFSSLEDHVRSIIDEKHDISKEKYCLHSTRNAIAEVVFAIRNAIYNNDKDAFCCIENRMKLDIDFNSDPFMAGVRENIKDICAAEKRNLANHELKNSEISKLAKERDKALEHKEFYKRQANSVYGMSIPCRCNGKKILINKEKYDDLIECVNTINATYDILKCADFTMNKPVWFEGIIHRIENLTI